MLKLKTADARLIDSYRRRGVLQRVYGPKLAPRSENLIVVACADGHQLPDIIEHLGKFTFCRHTLTVHGGALRLAPDFPENGNAGFPVGPFLLHQIWEARGLKDTNRLVLIAHHPCAIATRHGFGIEQILKLTLDAETRIKADLPEAMSVIPLFQYCDGDQRRTLYINGKHFRRLA